MTDLSGVLHAVIHLLPGRYGSWLNYPDQVFPCYDENGVAVLDGSCTMAEYTGTFELRKLHAVYQRTPSGGIPQDVALTTHHFLNLTSDAPDATWATADYQQVETAFLALWNTLKTYYSDATKLAELRWYADGPNFKPFGDSPSPMLRSIQPNVAGISTNSTQGWELPPQVAVSVTEVTAARYSTVAREGRPSQLRHRWGRFYLPAPGYATMGTGASIGRLSASFQGAVATAVQTFYNACRGGNQLIPVMYSPTTGHAWTVDEIHVDDIYDVIRSRRYEVPTSRAVRTLTAI